MSNEFQIGFIHGYIFKEAEDKPYRDRVEAFGVKDGQILLGRYKGDDTYGTYGGGVDEGESPEEAAAREYEEESGLKLKNVKLLDVPPRLWEWGPPYSTDKQKARADKYRGSRTMYAVGDIEGAGKKGKGDDAKSDLADITYHDIKEAIKKLQGNVDTVPEDIRSRTQPRLEAIKAILNKQAAMEVIIAPRVEKTADITLDIDEGDTLLVGRFKNKPIKVEDIGEDENNQPTVNGRKLLAARIKKLMPKRTNK